MSFHITYKTHIQCFILSSLIAFLCFDSINLMYEELVDRGFFIFPTAYEFLNFIIFAVVFMVPISVIHEMLHGVSYRFFGHDVEYGFKGIYAYTKDISGKAMERNKFIITLLMPALVISIIAFLIGGGFGFFIFILNITGSTGDFIMAFYICRFKSTANIIDRDYGFDVDK